VEYVHCHVLERQRSCCSYEMWYDRKWLECSRPMAVLASPAARAVRTACFAEQMQQKKHGQELTAAAGPRPKRTRAEERQCCVVRAYQVKRLVCMTVFVLAAAFA
jgi:hypothetical protein